jgi:hypothetical protein
MDKFIQLTGIILLYVAALSGSEDIFSKKRACFSVRQPSILWANGMVHEGESKLKMTSLNAHFTPQGRGTKRGSRSQKAKVGYVMHTSLYRKRVRHQ